MKYIVLLWPLLAVFALLSEQVRMWVRWLFYEYRYAPSFVPAVLGANYLLFCLLTGGVAPQSTGVLVYLAAGGVLCVVALVGKSRVTVVDWVCLLWFWFGWTLKLADRRRDGLFELVNFDRPLIGISVVVMVLCFWAIERNLSGLKVSYRFSWKDVRAAAVELCWMVPVLLLLGHGLGFFHETKEYQALAAQYGHTVGAALRLAQWSYLGDLVLALLTVGLAEELLFRAGVQNFLDQRFGQSWKTLLSASLLFGAAHLTSGVSSPSFSNLNWSYGLMATVAGIGYGRVFRNTSFIGFGMFVHAWIDVTKNYLM